MTVQGNLQPLFSDQQAAIRALGQVIPHVGRFNSFQELVTATEKLPEKFQDRSVDPEFTGTTSFNDAIRKARSGDIELGRKAEQMINELSDQGILSLGPSALGLDVVGMVPCVPAFLSGYPESMLAQVESTSIRAPIRVFAGIGAGGGVSTDAMLNRGIAITAFVLAMAAIRPVELYAYTCAVSSYDNAHLERYGIAWWPVDTRPVDLASVAFQVSHPSVHRVIGFSMADGLTEIRGGGRPLPCHGDRDAIEKVSRVVFGCEPQDVVIPRVTNPRNDPLIRNPTAWLKEVIQSHIDGAQV